jgi:multidrug efflux pump subunit AcrA (membrane-fusion protein)
VEKRVRTGRRADNYVEIIDGIKPGEAVVVQPGNLVGGQPVQIVQ